MEGALKARCALMDEIVIVRRIRGTPETSLTGSDSTPEGPNYALRLRGGRRGAHNERKLSRMAGSTVTSRER